MKAGITALDSFNVSITVQTFFGVTKRFLPGPISNKCFYCVYDAGIATTR